MAAAFFTPKNMKKKIKALIKKTFRLGVYTAVILGILVLYLNLGVILAADGRTYADGSALTVDNPYDCVIVLGCGVRPDGTPTDMLNDRVVTAVSLYHSGKANKLLMSGDHGRVEYDEVNVMKNLAISLGVPSEDIFMDHAGFSTYETMARASHIFGVDRAIVVTQDFHLARALYLAGSFGIDAVGVKANPRLYYGQTMSEARELAARPKDILYSLFRPAYVGGEAIDITGDGNVTNG